MTDSQIYDAVALVILFTGGALAVALALVFIPWWVLAGIVVLSIGLAST